MDVEKQVEYWRKGAEEDLAVAEELLEKSRFRHALFFAHLAVEKMLKAHVTRATLQIPPRIHNLLKLADKSGLDLSAERIGFLRIFNLYQLHGRYPEEVATVISPKTARDDMAAAKEMLAWLKAKL